MSSPCRPMRTPASPSKLLRQVKRYPSLSDRVLRQSGLSSSPSCRNTVRNATTAIVSAASRDSGLIKYGQSSGILVGDLRCRKALFFVDREAAASNTNMRRSTRRSYIAALRAGVLIRSLAARYSSKGFARSVRSGHCLRSHSTKPLSFRVLQVMSLTTGVTRMSSAKS